MFEEFWSMYPRKVKKKKAKEIWEKQQLNKNGDAILAALKKMNEIEYFDKDVQFIPHPTTWLNDERWEDEIVDVKEVAKLRFLRGGK